jgi:hypothetical protein
LKVTPNRRKGYFGSQWPTQSCPSAHNQAQ